MAYAKINSIANDAMAKVNSAAKAALGKIGSIDAPASSVNAPVTSGLVGYFRADEGITTDTSGGTTSVSQWDNVASDNGGEASQTWNLTQGTKSLQPVYDASAKTVFFDGTDYLGGLSGKMPYDSDWSIVWIADGSAGGGFTVWAGGSSVATYIRFHSANSPIGPRFSNSMQWSLAFGNFDPYPNIYSGDYHILGMTFDASQAASTYEDYGYILNQHLFTPGDDCDHGNCVGPEGPYDNYSAPQDVDFLNIGNYTGGTAGANYYAREVMIFNKTLNQTEVTAIYNYADGIVTLDAVNYSE